MIPWRSTDNSVTFDTGDAYTHTHTYETKLLLSSLHWELVSLLYADIVYREFCESFNRDIVQCIMVEILLARTHVNFRRERINNLVRNDLGLLSVRTDDEHASNLR